ncbi:DUF1015 domain-containing protein [Deferribacter autotrophicus]|uniref:DUF1015 domain-containing protein n=2 Tax=Deferribacter autotrophicus TaxID=500465 RepID=A0A5A8F1X8_9BACT|nr:DUF1015 domain-containing protein [Deferribacter autotrophicus]
MVMVKPFKGVRYNLEKTLLKQVLAPPYDVISEEQKEILKLKSPYNVVRLILPDGENKYEEAARLYNEWKKEGILIKDSEPSFYLYEQEYEYEGKKYVRTGFIGLMKLEEYGKGNVFPHEKTLAGPKMDRFNLMKAAKANFSQIFGLYIDKSNKLEKLFSAVKKDMPAASAVNDEGVKNSLWLINDDELKEEISHFMRDKKIYIADGHHRYETALRYRDYMREINNDSEDEIKPYDFVMMMFVNFYDEGLKVFPTHRVVEYSNNFDDLMDKIQKMYDIKKVGNFEEGEKLLTDSEIPSFLMYRKGEFFIIRIRDEEYEKLHPIYRKVDTYVLQETILKGVIGFTDEKLLKKEGIYFVQNMEQIEKIEKEKDIVAFIIKGVDIEIIREIAENGLVMPQKSTYFYPKLDSGLVFNDLA